MYYALNHFRYFKNKSVAAFAPIYRNNNIASFSNENSA